MPPRDPRLCPALERALPADDPDPGNPSAEWRGDFSPWQFLFGDGAWHPVTVRAWWLDKAGREVVQIEWSIAGETFGDSYIADPGKMREFPG